MSITKTVNTKKRLNLSQAYFNPLLLFFYDWIVYSIVSKYIWGCSVDLLLSRYRAWLQCRCYGGKPAMWDFLGRQVAADIPGKFKRSPTYLAENTAC